MLEKAWAGGDMVGSLWIYVSVLIPTIEFKFTHPLFYLDAVDETTPLLNIRRFVAVV